MNIKNYTLFSAALLLSANLNAATIQSINVQGQLADNGLTINAAHDNAFFNGTFSFDLDDRLLNPDPFYQLTSWNINLSTGVTFQNNAELHDSATMNLNRASHLIQLQFFEDIDNLGTLAIERRTLQLTFDSGINIITSTTFESLSTDNPNFGNASNFTVGTLSFSTSQFPTSVANASLTVASAVPEPATFLLLTTSLLGLIGVSKRNRK